jgi:hypothetical protein
MIDIETARFTVGVFQDVAWAQKGLDALKAAGLPREALTILGIENPETAALIERALGAPGNRVEVAATGAALARGPLVDVLQGPGNELSRLGLGRTMQRVGFQSHDARIYESLTARGGVLVAVCSESRAADALAVLLSYGGGNAAIGAWTGRV